ncbi:MAG: hypothetical protein QOI00_1535 [Chloroflexota bacterium]|jgi:hypothetical protein|nr:hypothetical protein [Chloroflexota bacterium]
MDETQRNFEPHVAEALEPGERVRVQARSTDAVLAVTDRRLVVASPHRIALAVPISALRRIQFDIERHRPATLVIVPEQASYEAQVLSIPPEHYADAADALVAIGHELAPIETAADEATS